MDNSYETFKEKLATDIGKLGNSTFSAREAIYNHTRQKLVRAHGKPEQLSSLQRAIRDTETEITNLSRRHIDLLARRAKTILKLALPVIGALFVAVNLKEIPFVSLLGTIDTNYVFKVTLTGYYFVMGLGFAYDIDTQKQIYLLDPRHGRLGWAPSFAIGMYLSTAALLFGSSSSYIATLLGVSSTYTIFAIALFIWHFSGMYFWRVTTRHASPLLEESIRSATLRQDYLALQRLQLVREYLSGSWHAPRHTILSILVLLFGLFAIPNPVSRYITSSLIPHHFGVEVTDSQLLAYLFMAYAVFGEGWTWVRRFVTRISLNVFQSLERQYTLTKRAIFDPSEDGSMSPLW
jgi:hypothetical protein